MKKKLESELMSIAHRILKLKGKEDVAKMHAEVSALYEKLTVLKFANENFDEKLPTIGNDSSFFGMLDTAFNNKISDNIEVENKTYINVDENENEAITEPLMETIKDMVAQMPMEADKMDEIFEEIKEAKTYSQKKNDFEDITSAYKETPVFDPVDRVTSEKKSLNDMFNKGEFKIGLNEKILSKIKDNNKRDNAELKQSYEKIRKKITSKKKLELYSEIVLDFSKNLLENKEYELHDKLSSLIRFHSKEGKYKHIYYSVPYILYKENIIDKKLYNVYKESSYYTRITKKKQYYYLKDNHYSFDNYYKKIKPKNKLKYNIEYFISDFIVNKNQYSSLKRKIIIKSL